MSALEQFIHDLADLTTAEDRMPDDALATTVSELLQELVARRPRSPSSSPGGQRPTTAADGTSCTARPPSRSARSCGRLGGRPPHTHETWGQSG